MLREIPHVRQIAGEEPRSERALTWNAPARYSHMAVDDGESRAFRYKATPILIPDGTFDARYVGDAFVRESANLPSELVNFILAKLRQHQESKTAGE